MIGRHRPAKPRIPAARAPQMTSGMRRRALRNDLRAGGQLYVSERSSHAGRENAFLMKSQAGANDKRAILRGRRYREKKRHGQRGPEKKTAQSDPPFDGHVTAVNLAEEHNVSPATIRRDAKRYQDAR